MAMPAVARDVRHRGQDAGGGKQQRDVREWRDEEKRDEGQLLRRGVVAPELEPNLKNEGVAQEQAEQDDRRDVSFVRYEGCDGYRHGQVGTGRDAGYDPLALVHLASTALPCLPNKSLGYKHVSGIVGVYARESHACT